MPPDEPTDEEREEELPEDGQTPFSAADDELDEDVDDVGEIVTKHLDDTHPDTDTDLQQEGIYQDGLADEAGVSEPNAGNTVLSYDPEAADDSHDGAS